jgi:hypothetical protein
MYILLLQDLRAYEDSPETYVSQVLPWFTADEAEDKRTSLWNYLKSLNAVHKYKLTH